MNIDTILMTIFSTTFLYAAPLIYTSIGGSFSELAGVVNVGLEGIMVMGAFSSTVFSLYFAKEYNVGLLVISILIGGLAGVVFSILHAVATVNFHANHIISGTVLNLLAPATAVFLTRILYSGKGQTPNLTRGIETINVPGLNKIPLLGSLFFKNASITAYLGIAIAFVSWYVLMKTRFGLRIRSVGENPEAADTLGINVTRYRYAGVLISGLLGGIGGAVMAQSVTLNFSVSTISGQGFMALAAMIFGKWNPIGAAFASVFFGLAQSLPIISAYIPGLSKVNSVWFQIAPYVITIVVLVLFFGKSIAPAADGVDYKK